MCVCVCIFVITPGGNRLRVDDDLHGIGPPLCEDQTLIEAGIIQGSRVILEKGTPPLSNEVYNTFVLYMYSLCVCVCVCCTCNIL